MTVEASRKLEWTVHPVMPLPTREQLQSLVAIHGEDKAAVIIADIHHQREEAIRLERHDPLRYGYEPETFKKARELLERFDELYIFGGNREGKTVFAIKYAVEQLVNKPNQMWAFLHMTEQSSIRQQQAKVHAMLPPEWRDLGKLGDSIYVKYTKQNGFSGSQFILPNGSTAMFFNYKQDPDVLQGYELDGAVPDELVPLEFIENLAFRVGKGRKLKVIVNFTPVNGYTPTVSRAIVGATVTESRRAALLPADVRHHRDCPPGHLPYVMESRGRAAVFFHSGMNPYGAGEEIQRELRDKPLKMVKERAYGWSDKLVTSALPKYGKVHRITRAKFNEIAKDGGTRYCVADPGDTKNWFIKWYFVTPQNWKIIYREWPLHNLFGDWALHPEKEGKIDWRAGEAQRMEAGRGMSGYRSLILETEGAVWLADKKEWDMKKAEKIHCRLIDPRLGVKGVPSMDEGTSIIELMETPAIDIQGRHVPPMIWEQAPHTGVGEGIQLINDALDYDTERSVDVTNCPTLYVVDDLAHTDLCYREFTGMGTDKDALKDIIDPDRYFLKSGYGHVEEAMLRVRRQTYF